MSGPEADADLSDLAVESIEVVQADSLGSATYGLGMPQLVASSVKAWMFAAAPPNPEPVPEASTPER